MARGLDRLAVPNSDIASPARQRGARHSSTYGLLQLFPLSLPTYALAKLNDTFNLSVTNSTRAFAVPAFSTVCSSCTDSGTAMRRFPIRGVVTFTAIDT
jgi:hypothetical protein